MTSSNFAAASVRQVTLKFLEWRYQEALRELIEAKMKGLTVKPREIAAPPPVVDLMAALKHSLAPEASGSKHSAPKKATPMRDCRPQSGPCGRPPRVFDNIPVTSAAGTRAEFLSGREATGL
jgi:hypothetical protein